jgi:hypothetical protein
MAERRLIRLRVADGRSFEHARVDLKSERGGMASTRQAQLE